MTIYSLIVCISYMPITSYKWIHIAHASTVLVQVVHRAIEDMTVLQGTAFRSSASNVEAHLHKICPRETRGIILMKRSP